MFKKISGIGIIAILIIFTLIIGCTEDNTTGPKEVAQHGTVTKEIYNGDTIIVYQTPGATNSSPALYMLHSFGSDYTEMTDRYELNEVADYLYAQGHIKDMIIIMPNFTSDFGGSFLSDVASVEDFVMGIETELAINPSKRGVGGLGMGGYGAVYMALNASGLFESVSSHSGFLYFDELRNLIPNVRSENPRGILFSGKIYNNGHPLTHEGDGEFYPLVDQDTLFASGDFGVNPGGIIDWGATHEVMSEFTWMENDYHGNEFSNGTNASIDPYATLGIGTYTNSPTWSPSEWEFLLLESGYRNSLIESDWIWPEPVDDTAVPTTAYFRREYNLHPVEREEGPQDTFYLQWSLYPTGQFKSGVTADSFWVYINEKMVACGEGFDTYPHREQLIQGSSPFTIDDLYQDSTGVIAIKVQSTMAPAAFKPNSSLFYAMGAAFTPNYSTPQYPYMPVDTLGNYWGVDLPFDSNGTVDEILWRVWQGRDVYNLLDDATAPDFNNLNIYLDSGADSRFRADFQTEWFHAKLDEYGIDHTFETYAGGHTDQFYGRIKNLLMFHSDSF